MHSTCELIDTNTHTQTEIDKIKFIVDPNVNVYYYFINLYRIICETVIYKNDIHECQYISVDCETKKFNMHTHTRTKLSNPIQQIKRRSLKKKRNKKIDSIVLFVHHQGMNVGWRKSMTRRKKMFVFTLKIYSLLLFFSFVSVHLINSRFVQQFIVG